MCGVVAKFLSFNHVLKRLKNWLRTKTKTKWHGEPPASTFMLTFSIKYRKRIHERYVSPKYNPICSNSSLVPAVSNQTQQALNIESMFVPVSERGQDHKLSCMRFSNFDRKFAGISKFTSKLSFFAFIPSETSALKI